MDFRASLMSRSESAQRSVESPATPHSPRLPAGGDSDYSARKRSLDSAIEPPVDTRQKRKVTRACDTCKSKKAKCSGTQPCDSCAKRGISCLYEARYLRGKPPTPPPSGVMGRSSRGAIPSAHSRSPQNDGRALSVVSLLPSFQAVNARHEVPDSAAGRPNVPAEALHFHSRRTTDQLPISTNLDVQSDSSGGPEPSLQTAKGMAHPDIPSRASPELEVAGQYSDSTSGHSFLHRAWRRLSNNQHGHLMSGSLGSGEDDQRLSHAGDIPFQDQGLAQIPNMRRSLELFDLYFDICIATYRLLHRPTVVDWLGVVVRNHEQHLPLYHGLNRPRAAIVVTILTIATFHEEKARGGDPSVCSPLNDESYTRQSDALFCEALRLTETETGFPKLESAQVRLIQVLYLLMSSRMNQAWYTFGNALQIISALGLHRCEDRKRPSQKRDYIEQQCRKRTFWVAYMLDKYMGVIFGRPRHYHDDDIDQHFPDPVNDEDMTSSGPLDGANDTDCHIEALIHHARLTQIAEKISREVYTIKAVPDDERIAASHRLARELKDWKASLPSFLGSINPSSLISSFRRQSIALKLAYSHTVMLAHRPFLLKNLSNRQEIREMARENINECISAARSVLESVDRMARDGRLFHAFWWTHYVCFCALSVVYVWAIQQSNDTVDLDQDYVKIFNLAERCLTHLAQATASNSPSRRYSIILQELRLEAKRKTARRPAEAMVNIGHNESSGGSLTRTQSNLPLAQETINWEPMFGSPIDTAVPAVSNFLDDWRTTDWLELDSSAFVAFEHTPIA